MISNKLKALCGMVLVGGMMVSGTTIAANEAMKKFFETQLQNGNITQQQYDDLIKALENDNQAMEKQVDEKVSEATKDVPKITTKEKFAIESPDGNFEWGIGGRIQADAAFYDNDTDDTGASTQLGSGQEIRRARLEMTGKLWKVWGLKLQIDFENDNDIDLEDAFITYDGFSNTQLKVGNFKEPFSLEELTSSKYITFMERAMPVEAFAPSRNMGIGASSQFADMVTVAGGVFGEGVSSGGGPVSSGIGVTGRATFSPVHEEGRVLHFGGAVSHRRTNEDDTFAFSSRPESHVTDTRLVDTGDLAGIDDVNRYGLEAAGVWNRLSLQGEYIMADVGRENGFGPDFDIDGYYIFGSFFLTDDTRPYKFSSGSFDKVSPKSIVGKGGYGAWEVALRYSSLDLDDNSAGILGGDQDNLTAALNWYATKNIRFSANYVHVLDHSGGNFPGAEPAALQARAQVFW